MIGDGRPCRLQRGDLRQHFRVGRGYGEMQARAEPLVEQVAPRRQQSAVVFVRMGLADIGELVPLLGLTQNQAWARLSNKGHDGDVRTRAQLGP